LTGILYELDSSRPRIPALRKGGTQEAVAGGLMRIHSPSRRTMPAYKPPKVEPASTPSVDSPPQARWLEDGETAAQDRVLAEISHELGNLFHKLYYWAEFLQERRGDHSSDAPAVQMLTQTVGGLEEFLKGVLDYFRPLKLAPIRMAVSDLIAGMVIQMRSQLLGWPVRVSDSGAWEQRSVLIDPVRLPAVLLAAGRRLTERAPAGSGVHIAFLGLSDGVEVTFRVEGAGGTPGLQSAATCIEWGVAERIVALHGGRLRERAVADGPHALVLFLPFQH
jgi:hypothetical protein